MYFGIAETLMLTIVKLLKLKLLQNVMSNIERKISIDTIKANSEHI